MAIGLAIGVCDAAAIQLGLITDQIDYVPPRIWLVEPLIWASVSALLVILVGACGLRRFAIPLVVFAGLGLLVGVRVVVWIRFAHPEYRLELPFLTCVVLAGAASMLILRLQPRTGFIRASPALRSIPWLVAVVMALTSMFGSSTTIGYGHEQARKSKRPNVIIVFADTLRYDYSGFDGSRANAPNLGHFADSALVYENAWSGFPWTLPAHVSMLTGVPAEELGVDFDRQTYRQSPPTLAERFQRQGYYTAAFFANAWLNPGSGVARGFDGFEWSTNDLDVCRSGVFFLVKMIPDARVPLCRMTATDLTQRATRVIARARRPYFMAINYMEPHLPMYVPSGSRPPGYRAFRPLTEYAKFDAAQSDSRSLTPEDVTNLRQNYATAVRYLDLELGRLFQSIDRSPDSRNTVVVVVGDHGEQFGEHNLYLHANSVYRQVLHVPLAIRGPGFTKGRYAAPVSTTWLYGTLSIISGARVPRDTRRLPLPNEPPPDVVRSIYTPPPRLVNAPRTRPVGSRSIISGRYQFIRSNDGSEQIYDVTADPAETRNLVSMPVLQPIRIQLRNLTLRWPVAHGNGRESRRRLFSLGYMQ